MEKSPRLTFRFLSEFAEKHLTRVCHVSKVGQFYHVMLVNISAQSTNITMCDFICSCAFNIWLLLLVMDTPQLYAV